MTVGSCVSRALCRVSGDATIKKIYGPDVTACRFQAFAFSSVDAGRYTYAYIFSTLPRCHHSSFMVGRLFRPLHVPDVSRWAPCWAKQAAVPHPTLPRPLQTRQQRPALLSWPVSMIFCIHTRLFKCTNLFFLAFFSRAPLVLVSLT